jgi:hypothetical protein
MKVGGHCVKMIKKQSGQQRKACSALHFMVVNH